VNIELLKQAVKWARYEYETHGAGSQWQQFYWFTKLPLHPEATPYEQIQALTGEAPCKTGMCIAGHIVHEAGYEPAWESRTGRAHRVFGESDTVSGLAARLLEVPEGDTCGLFFAANSIEDLEREAKALVKKHGMEW